MRFPRLMAFAGAAVLIAGVQGCNKGGGAGGGGKVELKTDEDKTFYALGLFEAQRMSAFKMSAKELALVQAGIADGTLGKKPEVELSQFQPKLQALYESRRKAEAEKAKEKGKQFLDEAAKEPGAEKTASGLIYKSLKEGTGPNPTAADVVKVNYEGKLTTGEVFDSSYQRNMPAEFPLGGVIKCWTEGVQKMKVGGKAKLVCPSDIAYGEMGSPPKIPGGATLVFEVELLEIKGQPGAAPGAPVPAPAPAPAK